jgi:hypothetical protein
MGRSAQQLRRDTSPDNCRDKRVQPAAARNDQGILLAGVNQMCSMGPAPPCPAFQRSIARASDCRSSLLGFPIKVPPGLLCNSDLIASHRVGDVPGTVEVDECRCRSRRQRCTGPRAFRSNPARLCACLRGILPSGRACTAHCARSTQWKRRAVLPSCGRELRGPL